MPTTNALLAHAIHKQFLKELVTPKDLFNYLYDLDFFQSKLATNAFVNVLLDMFPTQTKAAIQHFVKISILDKVAENTQKYANAHDVFKYIDSIGLFFGDTSGRIRFMQLTEQMTEETNR